MIQKRLESTALLLVFEVEMIHERLESIALL